ncbi:MAG: lipid A biosynthesis acyltransferase [Burkholderiaceae bacterium]
MGEFAVRIGIWLLRGIALLPRPAVRAISDVAGDVVYLLAAPRRRVTLRNLELCFPDMDPRERRRIARGHFRAFVRSFIDRFVFWFGSPERIRRLCSIEGYEHFEANEHRPVILLAPHFVGMDAGGVRITLESTFASMFAVQKSKVLTEVMTKGRSRFNGARMLLRNEGMRPALRVLRDGIPFYFLPDMDLGPRDAVFVPFFGVPAATVTSVARLAKIARAVVIPCVTRMTDDGYVVTFHPAWEDYPGTDVVAATRRVNAFIEERVREMPEQYLFSHKRFKTRPPGEPDLYRHEP